MANLKEINWFLYLTTLTVVLLSLTGGMTITWSSPVLPKLQNITYINDNPLHRLLTTSEASWVTSLLALGATIGPFIGAYTTDKYGRKFTLILTGLPLLCSSLIIAFANNVIYLYIARFASGLSLGVLCMIVPLYIGEVSPDCLRGRLTSLGNMFLTIGMLLTLILGSYLSIMIFSLISAIICLIYITLFVTFMPESPYYLCQKFNYDLGLIELKKLRSTSDECHIRTELEKIKDVVKIHNNGRLKDLFHGKNAIKAIVIAFTLSFLQPLTGINIVLFTTEKIFEETNTSIPPNISSIIIGIVQVISTHLTPFLVDKLGRKLLLLTSIIGMIISQLTLGTYFYLKDINYVNLTSVYWLPILCFVLYISFYNLGFGPVPWIIMGEIFPSNIKSTASSLTVSLNGFAVFITSLIYFEIIDDIGMANSFWGFCIFNVISIIFVVLCVPETKGKSFKEIQELL